MKPCPTCRFLRNHAFADGQPSGRKLCAVNERQNYLGRTLQDLDGCEQHKENEHERPVEN